MHYFRSQVSSTVDLPWDDEEADNTLEVSQALKATWKSAQARPAFSAYFLFK